MMSPSGLSCAQAEEGGRGLHLAHTSPSLRCLHASFITFRYFPATTCIGTETLCVRVHVCVVHPTWKYKSLAAINPTYRCYLKSKTLCYLGSLLVLNRGQAYRKNTFYSNSIQWSAVHSGCVAPIKKILVYLKYLFTYNFQFLYRYLIKYSHFHILPLHTIVHFTQLHFFDNFSYYIDTDSCN